MSFRVAILYASVGTGHRTAAMALEKWFQQEIPDPQVLCLDTLSFSLPIVRGVYTRSYLEMVRHMPHLWGYFYETTDDPETRNGVIATLGELTEKLNILKLKKTLLSFSPDAIVFTHFFGAAAIAESFAPDIPVCYVNTDFLSHVFHRNPAFSAWFVSSEETLNQYLADGLSLERVFLTGIPVDPAYASPPGREEARERLGLDMDERIALVMGGGIGVGPIEEVVLSLHEGGFATEVICGINEKVRGVLLERFADRPGVRVHGFVDNMPCRYASADIIFMKPGGLSTSEALCSGTPIVVTDPIPGQEQRNSDYLLDRGAARALFDYRLAAEKAHSLLSSRNEKARVLRAAKRIARPMAGREIVRKVKEIKDQ